MSSAASEEAIVFRFDAKLVPYVGIWISQGTGPNRPDTVALEPCNGK